MSVATMVGWGASARRRTARKGYSCDENRDGRRHRVMPGDVYLEMKFFPGHDLITVSRPTLYRVCARCACKLGHEHLLDPIPYDQLCRDGLL